MEVNKADYRTLLRVPGIGVNSARRIIAARKTAVLGFKDLKAMGIVLKRAVYFITCNGRMMYPIKLNEDFITRELLTANDRLPYGIDRDITYKQLSLFDDISFKSDYKQDAKTDIKLVPQRFTDLVRMTDLYHRDFCWLNPIIWRFIMDNTKIFVCENSIDGIFTAIYQAWSSGYGHANVKIEEQCDKNNYSNMELFSEYIIVKTDFDKALKVSKSIQNKISKSF